MRGRFHYTYTINLRLNFPSSQRLPFLKALHSILVHCLPLHSEVSCNRLTKAVLSSITTILPSQSDFDQSTDTVQIGRSKKGKKRARAYEGDELLKVSRNILFPLSDDGKAVLVACDGMSIFLPEMITVTYICSTGYTTAKPGSQSDNAFSVGPGVVVYPLLPTPTFPSVVIVGPNSAPKTLTKDTSTGY